MELKNFSVFDAITNSFKAVANNMGFFFPLFLALVAIFIGALVLIGLLNGDLIQESFNTAAVMKNCQGAECIPLLRAFFTEAVKKYAFMLALSFILLIVFFTWIYTGYINLMLAFNAGRSVSLSTLFCCITLVPKVFIALLLFMILVGLGLLVFIIPGIYLILRLRFFIYFLLDQHAGIIESLQASWRMTRGYTWDVLSLFLLGMGLLGLGAITLFFVFPVMQLSYIVMYRALAGKNS